MNGLPSAPVDRAETDMQHFDPGRNPEFFGSLENLLKVQRLPLVHDINDFVGLKVVITHFNRCNIGNLVAETAVALNQDNRAAWACCLPQAG